MQAPPPNMPVAPGDRILPRPATTDLALPEHSEMTVKAVQDSNGRRVVFLVETSVPLCELLGDEWIVVESRSN